MKLDDEILTRIQMEHNEERMDAKLDMIQRSRVLGRAAIPRSEGGYSDSVGDSDVGPLRMSDVGEGDFDDIASSVAGVSERPIHLKHVLICVAHSEMRIMRASPTYTLSPTRVAVHHHHWHTRADVFPHDSRP